jgi:hypothetical protein
MDCPEVIDIVKSYEERIASYEERIALLETQMNDTKEHLKKYTAPSNMKKYYENHKEEIKKRVKDYKEKTNYEYHPTQEQKKKWARTAYLNKKSKNKMESAEETGNV